MFWLWYFYFTLWIQVNAMKFSKSLLLFSKQLLINRLTIRNQIFRIYSLWYVVCLAMWSVRTNFCKILFYSCSFIFKIFKNEQIWHNLHVNSAPRWQHFRRTFPFLFLLPFHCLQWSQKAKCVQLSKLSRRYNISWLWFVVFEILLSRGALKAVSISYVLRKFIQTKYWLLLLLQNNWKHLK